MSLYLRFLIILGVFLIPITLKRLLSNKLVTEVSIDDDNQILRIKFRKSVLDIHFDELGFAIDSGNWSFNELTFYKLYTGTRGQTVKKYVTDIIGMKWTRSWRKSQIESIASALRKRGIPSFKPTHRELPLWERFI